MGVRRSWVAALASGLAVACGASSGAPADGGAGAAAGRAAGDGALPPIVVVPPAEGGAGDGCEDGRDATGACALDLSAAVGPVRLATLASSYCGAGTTDGEGRFVALPRFGDGPGAWMRYRFAPIAGGAASDAELAVQGVLVPQPRGYHLRPGGSSLTPPTARARPSAVYDSEGALTRIGGTLGDVVTLVRVPGSGGSVAVTVADDGSGGKAWRLERVDVDGDRLAAYDLGAAWDVGILAVNGSQHTLIWSGGTRFRWFDEALAPMTDWFELPILAAELREALPLADGSVALSRSRALPDGATALSCAPRWLRELRDDVTPELVLGGRGYALLPKRETEACARGALEVVTAEGAPCGEIQLGAGACRVSIGADGTAFTVEQGPFVAASPGDPELVGACTWTWWPGLLR